jgi:membrane protease YdiL (CAAX protease family)
MLLVKFIGFILAATFFSLLFGKIDFLAENKGLMKKVARFCMTYVRAGQDTIVSSLITIFYLASIVCGLLVFSLVYEINIFKYLVIDKEYVIYIFIGICAELTIANLLVSFLSGCFKQIDFRLALVHTKWADRLLNLPAFLMPIIPAVAGLIEEIFFRGLLLIILVEYYAFIGPFWIIAIVSILFTVEQVIQTESKVQAISMAVVSLTISVIGCLLVIQTGSILPAIVARSCFGIYYFAGTRRPV